MWTCPKCGRKFRNTNQPHSCVQLEPAIHFEGKSPVVRKVFNKILGEVKKFGPVNLSVARMGILLKNESSFLSAKPKMNWLELEFLTSGEITDEVVYKSTRLSRNRVAHYVRLEELKDVNAKLIAWLREAYELTGK